MSAILSGETESTENLVADLSHLLDETAVENFSWRNVSVWGKRKETRGFWQRTEYTDFQIVKDGKYVAC